MSSQWYCKILDEKLGPLAFDDLVEMARSGTLSEGDRVLQEGTTVWVPARIVNGLFPSTAEGEQEDSVISQRDALLNSLIEENTYPTTTPRRPLPTGLQRLLRRIAVAGCTLLVVALIALVWSSAQPVRFPLPSRLQGQLPDGHSFLGTGPWSTLECAILWIDVFVIAAVLPLGYRLLRHVPPEHI